MNKERIFRLETILQSWDSTDHVASADLLSQFLQKELDNTRNTTLLNRLVKPASTRAYQEAVKWAAWATQRFTQIPPRVSVDGSGGIILQWGDKTDFVALHFDEDVLELDAIFYNIKGQIANEDMDEERLEELIGDLISDRDVSSDHSYYSPDQRAYRTEATIWPTYFEATAT